MKLPQRFAGACKHFVRLIAGLLLLINGLNTVAQIVPSPLAPAEGSSCIISAQNRNAPVMLPDYSYSIFGLSGASGAFRARVTCSDGSIGQTAIAFPQAASAIVNSGEITWGSIDPVPTALGLTALRKCLSTNDVSQLIATAINNDATTRDVTARANGTTYAISNALIADVSEGGQVKVFPLFAPGSSSRVVASAVTEGGAAASYMFILGPRGSLTG